MCRPTWREVVSDGWQTCHWHTADLWALPSHILPSLNSARFLLQWTTLWCRMDSKPWEIAATWNADKNSLSVRVGPFIGDSIWYVWQGLYLWEITRRCFLYNPGFGSRGVTCLMRVYEDGRRNDAATPHLPPPLGGRGRWGVAPAPRAEWLVGSWVNEFHLRDVILSDVGPGMGRAL